MVKSSAGRRRRVDITVTNALGTSTIVAADQFTYVDLPTSSVQSLPATSGASFTVSWSGQAAAGSTGIARYDIYSSDNNGPFTIWKAGATSLSGTFTGQNGHTYGFYSVATDNQGGVQPTPSAAQAVTTVSAIPPVSKVTALPAFSKPSFTVAWSGTDVGGPASPATTSMSATMAGRSPPSRPGRPAPRHLRAWAATYRFYSVATDKNGSREADQARPRRKRKPATTPNKQYTDAIYSDLLGRSPDLGGLNFWSGRIDGRPGALSI